MAAERLFEPPPPDPRRRAPVVYGGGKKRAKNSAENARVRALYHTHVLGYDVPVGHQPTLDERKRSAKARGRFNEDMQRTEERLGRPQWGKLQPSAHSSTSPRTAHERAIDAHRTPMRRFFDGTDVPSWALVNILATLAELHGMAYPGEAYTVQLDFDKYRQLQERMRQRRGQR